MNYPAKSNVIFTCLSPHECQLKICESLTIFERIYKILFIDEQDGYRIYNLMYLNLIFLDRGFVKKDIFFRLYKQLHLLYLIGVMKSRFKCSFLIFFIYFTGKCFTIFIKTRTKKTPVN